MKIVTDSACDLKPDEIKELGISVAPLYIHFPEGEIASDLLTPDEFYNRLVQMQPEIPTTSQPSSGGFARMYSELARLKEDILSIHISSGLSGTIESARAGAHPVKDASITLVDSLTLSGGERFQVLAAARAVRAGWSCDAILERLKLIRAASEVCFTLDTLTYLARGGRIGRVQALAGALLKIKPVISVDKLDGKYNTAGRGRTIGKALEQIVDRLKSIYGAHTPLWVSVMHGQFQEQAELLAQMINQQLQVARLETLRVSPVLGVHTGPGVVGAAVVPAALFDDLQ